MCRCLSCSVTLIVLTLAAAEVAAPSPRIGPGSRVRVTTAAEQQDGRGGSRGAWPSARHSGIIRKLDARRLILTEDGAHTPMELDRADVLKIEVSAGSDSRLRRFALGAGVGLVVGATVGGLAGSTSEPSGFFTRSDAIAMGAVAIGTAGAVLGGLIGAATGGEKWETVHGPFSDLEVGVLPQVGGGVSLAAVRRF